MVASAISALRSLERATDALQRMVKSDPSFATTLRVASSSGEVDVKAKAAASGICVVAEDLSSRSEISGGDAVNFSADASSGACLVALATTRSGEERVDVSWLVSQCEMSLKTLRDLFVASELFRKKQYLDAGTQVLRTVATHWRGILPLTLISDAFDGLFDPNVAPLETITCLGGALFAAVSSSQNRATQRRVVGECARLLSPFFAEKSKHVCHCFSAIGEFPNEQERAEMLDALLKVLGSIPDRVMAVLGNKSPLTLCTSQYFSSLCAAIVASCLDPSSVKCRSVAMEGLEKMCRLGKADQVVNAWTPHLLKDIGLDCSDKSAIFERHRALLNARMRILLPRMLESVVAAVDHKDSVKVLRALFPGALHEPVEGVVCRRVLLGRGGNRTLSPPALWALLDFLSLNASGVLLRTAVHVAALWSDAVFVTGTAPSFHTYISGILRGCFRRIDGKTIESSPLLLHLVQGVQAHLGCTDESAKRLGMIIGEEFSRIVDPENPLVFGETGESSEDAFSAEAEQRDVARSSANIHAASSPAADSASSNIRSMATIDTVAPESAPTNAWNDFFGDESDSDDDSDFDIGDMGSFEEEKDRDSVDENAPHFLRPCIDLLLADDFEAFALVLGALPRLIRTKPIDLDACAGELASRLVHLENKFAFDDFASLRTQSLVALIEMSPKKCSPVLAALVYSRNVTVGMRMDVLDILVAAARALSGSSQEDLEMAEKRNKETMLSKVPESERIGTVVRRWGTRRSAEPIKFKNRFVPLASRYFFYPLLPRTSSRNTPMSHLDLLKREPKLLSRLVLSLGALMECAQNAFDIASMAKAAYELVQWSKQSSHAGVRRACVYTLAICILAVPSNVLSRDFGDMVVEARSFLARTAAEDPDDLCRGHAAALLENVPALRAAASTTPF